MYQQSTQPDVRSPFVHFRVLVAFVLVAFMSGCVTVIAPEDMKPVNPGHALELMEPISVKYSSGLSVVREASLLPGLYRGVGDDGNGIWYIGDERAMRVIVLDRGGAIGYPEKMIGVPTFSSGGLFVPHDTAQQPQIFVRYLQFARQHDPMYIASRQQSADEDKSVEVVNSIAYTTRQSPSLSSMTPVQAGVGAGLAGGIISAMMEVDNKKWGKFAIFDWQPPVERGLRKHIRLVNVQ